MIALHPALCWLPESVLQFPYFCSSRPSIFHAITEPALRLTHSPSFHLAPVANSSRKKYSGVAGTDRRSTGL